MSNLFRTEDIFSGGIVVDCVIFRGVFNIVPYLRKWEEQNFFFKKRVGHELPLHPKNESIVQKISCLNWNKFKKLESWIQRDPDWNLKVNNCCNMDELYSVKLLGLNDLRCFCCFCCFFQHWCDSSCTCLCVPQSRL